MQSMHLLAAGCNSRDQHRLHCRRVIWQAAAGSRRGLYVEFEHINMHAIASDQSAARKPCIYMQLEPSTSAFADTADAEVEEEGDATPEVRLVPEDSSTCAPLSRQSCRAHCMNTRDRFLTEEGFSVED